MITSYQLTLGTGYIMAVEDSLVQAKKLRHFLDEKSINNAFYTNAKDALAAAHDRPPLLIISDIVMPGMDGYEFLCQNQRRSGAERHPGDFADLSQGSARHYQRIAGGGRQLYYKAL